MKQGLIHIYTGDGKGKTSAAVGACVRAAGHGWRILFVQFLKGSFTGELIPLEKLGVSVCRTEDVKKFVFQMDEKELARCREDHSRCFQTAADALRSGEYDLVVLDEVIGAVGLGLIDEEALVALLKEKQPKTEVILTGRGASDKLKKTADYLSEIRMEKHPYEQGIPARAGIEY